jgi:hypothetical protein
MYVSTGDEVGRAGSVPGNIATGSILELLVI